MSIARPRGLLSNGFELVDDSGLVVASLEGSIWREGGDVTVAPLTWRFERDGWSRFRLLRHGVEEAVARKRGAFSSTWEIRHESHVYLLARRSMWSRAYVVQEAGPTSATDLGGVAPTGVFTNAAEVDLPATLPLQLHVFVAAVVVTQWRRQASSASAGSAGSAGS